MTLRRSIGTTIGASTVVVLLLAGVRTGAQQSQSLVWAPRPAKLPAYVAPMKPHIRLADLKTAHRGQGSWRELVVDDGRARVEYVLEAAGTTSPKRFHPDTRVWWSVLEGAMRVEIEGQPPFTATRGSLVQIPKQTVYSVETAGDAPSLRFEVTPAGTTTLYPMDAAPPALPGATWTKTLFTRRPAVYDNGNQPHVNLFEAAKAEKYTGGRLVRDEHFDAMWIYGYEKDLPARDPKDRGHFHPGSPEFWLVPTGQIRYEIEGQEPFTADEGDFAYAPAGTYHLARFAGAGPSCRLSIHEFLNNTTLREP